MPKINKFFELKAAIMVQDLLDDDVAVSVCIDCARHDSLKRIIEADITPGICGFCCRTDAPVRNPQNTEQMVMLFRALIRFYWDEFQYNSHLGGDDALNLFSDEENPVVNPFFADTYRDELDHLLLSADPYPDPKEGISIYAGFHDGDRLINRAISASQPVEVGDIRKQLNASNFATFFPELEALFSTFVDELDFKVSKGEIWFRAREGVNAIFHRGDGLFGGEIVRQPHQGDDIGPSPKPGNGRLNRKGLPVLYLGSTAHTALAEIRPHPGHYVSIGGFTILEDLKVADFDADIALFCQDEERLQMYEIVNTFDRLMSTPVTPEDDVSYLITQLLAEVLKARGYDGVQFRSSVSDGKNLCIFEPSKARFTNGHSAVSYVKSLVYEAPEVSSTSVPVAGDYQLDR